MKINALNHISIHAEYIQSDPDILKVSIYTTTTTTIIIIIIIITTTRCRPDGT